MKKLTVTHFAPDAELVVPLELEIIEESKKTYPAILRIYDPNLDLDVFAFTVEALEKELKEQLVMLWQEFGLERDSVLSPPALELKKKLRALVKPQCLRQNPFTYKHCRVCGQRVSASHERKARRNISNAICGPECYAKERLKRVACCEKAVEVHCVCDISIECPDHGRKCHGTHD